MATINFLYRSTKDEANLILRLLFRHDGKDNVLAVNTKYSVSKHYWTKQHDIKKPKELAVVNKQHEVAEELNKIEKCVLTAFNSVSIGVVNKQGAGMFGDSNDTSVFFPANFLRKTYGDNTDFLTPVILIKPEKGVDMDAFKAEISQKLRNYRGMKTGEIDNFFVNVLSGFTDLLDGIISTMNSIGWGIALFSLLVGGFGIANIMFVSVKERTNLIGIQKSLGAKNKFILLQFLFESIILSIIGGIIGLLMVWGISIVMTKVLEFDFVLGFGNIMLGTGLSAFIGLISGILPAISASRLDPVEAIRTGM
jgi:putative ABC transport system permease protein